MLTITELARRCKLSRTTLLYYERQGLLQPSYRSENGYRRYGEDEIQRLETIATYRSYGLSVKSIKRLLDDQHDTTRSQILKDHFYQLQEEIKKLQSQQQAIVALLREPDLLEERTVSKERWVAIMQAAGFDESAMLVWHRKFEQMEPREHHRFLESLGIDAGEIKRIRAL